MADGGKQINHFSLRLETLVGRLRRQEARQRTAYLALLLHAKPSSAKTAPLVTPGPDWCKTSHPSAQWDSSMLCSLATTGLKIWLSFINTLHSPSNVRSQSKKHPFKILLIHNVSEHSITGNIFSASGLLLCPVPVWWNKMRSFKGERQAEETLDSRPN